MPRSPMKVNRLFGETYRLHLKGKRVSQARNDVTSCLAYSSTLQMEAAQPSETSVGFHRSTWHYVPEGRTHQSCFYYILSIDYCLKLVMTSINHTPKYEPSLPRSFSSVTSVITGCRLTRCCTLLSDLSLLNCKKMCNCNIHKPVLLKKEERINRLRVLQIKCLEYTDIRKIK
jgi:hypothetical protein